MDSEEIRTMKLYYDTRCGTHTATDTHRHLDSRTILKRTTRTQVCCSRCAECVTSCKRAESFRAPSPSRTSSASIRHDLLSLPIRKLTSPQLHYHGTEAVDYAARTLGFKAGEHVLDVGAGVGGAWPLTLRIDRTH